MKWNARNGINDGLSSERKWQQIMSFYISMTHFMIYMAHQDGTKYSENYWNSKCQNNFCNENAIHILPIFNAVPSITHVRYDKLMIRENPQWSKAWWDKLLLNRFNCDVGHTHKSDKATRNKGLKRENTVPKINCH